MRPTHVLHVMNSASGGAAESTMGLIGALASRGVQSSVVCHTAGSARDRARVTDGVAGRATFVSLTWWNKKIRAKTWKRPLLELRQIVQTGGSIVSTARVAQVATAARVDLIHTNTLVTPEGGRVARLLSLPHVWHARELVGRQTPYPLRHDGASLGRYLLKHASIVVANSHVTAAPLQALLPADRLSIVPNGLDVESFAPWAERRFAGPKSPDRALRVGMVANLTTAWKRHDWFLEVASRISRAIPVRFVLVGTLPAPGSELDRALQQNIDRLDLRSRVEFAGFCSDVPAVLSDLDVMLHPTPHESFGRVLIEGMATGLPVVGPAGGGVGELVLDGKTGFLSAPGDVAAMGAHVEQLLTDHDLRRRMGEEAVLRAGQYSLRACVDALQEVYDRAAARPLSPPLGARISPALFRRDSPHK